MRDDRFNYRNFARQPSYLIRQALKAIRQSRNLEQLTQARTLKTYMNVHRMEGVQPFEDEGVFLPHPAEWRMQHTARTLHISRQTAIAVLQSLSWLDSSVLAALEGWMPEIEAIARGN